MRKQNLDPTAQALACLAQNYEAVFNVDFETNQCENISFREEFEEVVRNFDPDIDTRGYNGRIGLLATVAVEPDAIKGFLECTSPNYVLDKLGKNDSHIVNFKTSGDGGTKYLQLKYVRNVFLGRKNVIVGLRNITGEMGDNFTVTVPTNDKGIGRRSNGVRVEKSMAITRVDGERRRLGDVLERSKFEGMQQTWNAFVYSISHSVRNPLNAILGYASMVDRYADKPEVIKEFANKIQVSGREMMNLLNDVVDMNALERNEIVLSVASNDITEVLSHVSTIATNEAWYRNVRFNEDRLDLADTLVMFDQQRLEQILVNILDNAVRYTNAGGKVNFITEELAPTEKGYANFRFTVTDTGVGMTEEIKKHLFNSFEYEKSEKLNVVQGTGIGMAITKGLVDLMGGTLDVESQLGVGTTVTCTFKFKLPEDLGKGRKKAEASIVGKKVLLVEDISMNREIAKLTLENEGLTVDEASDGAVAVDMVFNSEPGTYDFILMDLTMPYMSGYEAAKEIRAFEDKRLANIPIIALSANAYYDDRQRALEAGMNEYLSKPVNIRELIRVLKRIEAVK